MKNLCLCHSAILLSFLLFSNYVFCQQLKPSVTSSSGGFGQNSQLSLSWTIGEPVIATFITANNILTQGFNQPDLSVTSVEPDKLEYNVTVFPNPSSGFVVVSFADYDKGDFRASVYDISGRELLSCKLLSSETTIPFNDLAPATYILKIYDREKEISTFKINKN